MNDDFSVSKVNCDCNTLLPENFFENQYCAC